MRSNSPGSLTRVPISFSASCRKTGKTRDHAAKTKDKLVNNKLAVVFNLKHDLKQAKISTTKKKRNTKHRTHRTIASHDCSLRHTRLSSLDIFKALLLNGGRHQRGLRDRIRASLNGNG